MRNTCNTCGVGIESGAESKLLGKLYCSKCISKARSDRRKAINAVRNKPSAQDKRRETLRKKAEAEDRKRQANEAQRKAEEDSLQTAKQNVLDDGLPVIQSKDIPLRLKRGECVHFVGGEELLNSFKIELCLTNRRLFAANWCKAKYSGQTVGFSVAANLKAINLKSIIAVDRPEFTDVVHATSPETIIVIGQEFSDVPKDYYIYLHLSRGKILPFPIHELDDAAQLYVYIVEAIDRVNDPIDESAFTPKRERIPDEVKVTVWRRDGGVCARCGSRTNLEYDHIVPVSRGGANTVRNIELLCESCNRRKSDKIA